MKALQAQSDTVNIVNYDITGTAAEYDIRAVPGGNQSNIVDTLNLIGLWSGKIISFNIAI